MKPTEAPVADAVDAGPLRAESRRRIDALVAASKPPVPPVPAATSAGDGKPEGVSPATDTAKGAPATPDKAPVAPETVAAEDLSDFPEEFRSPEKQTTPEFRAWVRKEFTARGLRQADYTKKTTEAAELKRLADAEMERVNAAKSRIEFAETVLGDDEYVAAIEAVRAKRAGAKSEPFDYMSATPEQIAAHEAEIVNRAVSKALEATEAKGARVSAEERARFETVATAKAEFIDSGEYTADEVAVVYDAMVDLGTALTKENVVKALRVGLPKREPRPKDKPATKEVPEAKVEVGASVLTRKSGVAPTLATPAWVREHRAPKDASERLQATLLRRNAERAARGLDPYTL